MTSPFEYQIPIQSGIQMNQVFRCLVFRWLLYCIASGDCSTPSHCTESYFVCFLLPIKFFFQQVIKRFGENKIPLLDPVEDMKINEKPFKEIIKKISTFESRLTSHPMHDNPDLVHLLEAFKKKDSMVKEFEAAKLKLKKAKSLLQMAELNKMKRVLRRMKYCDQVKNV